MFNLNKIPPSIRYVRSIVINLSSPSKVKSSKSVFQGFPVYIFIKLSFDQTSLQDFNYIICYKIYWSFRKQRLFICNTQVNKISILRITAIFMFSMNLPIKITSRYFPFFCYSWSFELQFNQYKLLLFLWFIIHQLLF